MRHRLHVASATRDEGASPNITTNDARAKAEAKKADSNSDGRRTDEVSETGAVILPFIAPDQETNEWALRDSNPRPLPCEGSTLTS